MASNGVVTGDPFDAVLRGIATGTRKSPVARRTRGPAKPPSKQIDSGGSDSKLVAKFADWLSGMDESQRQRVQGAFAAAVDQVDGNQESDEAASANAPAAG